MLAGEENRKIEGAWLCIDRERRRGLSMMMVMKWNAHATIRCWPNSWVITDRSAGIARVPNCNDIAIDIIAIGQLQAIAS